jgi:hypothetical protein
MRKGSVPKEVARERERRAWELRQKFWTHERIAAELGVDRSTVTKMLARVSRRILDTMQSEVAAMKAEQVSQLTFIADEAMQAWNASKQPAKEARKLTRKTRKVADDETQMKSKDQNADPRYLATAMQALTDIRAIMGLNAPTKVAPTDPTGEKEHAELSDAERITKLMAIFDAARARRGDAPAGTDTLYPEGSGGETDDEHSA